MDRRIQIGIGLLLTIVVAGVFYISFVGPRSRARTKVVPVVVPQAVIRHPLSGLVVSEKPDFFAVSVMLDNISEDAARPGLEEARVVYEALAEGGITRLMAVFTSDQEVRQIGPVRSVRPYFIDWASEYGGAIMHVGGSHEALQILQQTDIEDIDQIGADERYFERDNSLSAPHNVFTTFNSWLQFGERLDIASARFAPWKYEDRSPANPSEQQIDIEFWTSNKVSWVYNKPTDSYFRFLNEERIYFTNGDQVASDNIIVIEVETEVIDSIGRLKMESLGSGKARIYTHGEVIESTWIKDARTSRMRFVSDDQQEVVLKPGTTWIEVVPNLESVILTAFDE